jgi:outer membrane immunogenic protein
MKRLLFIAIAAAALSGAPAIAAELPLKAAPLLFDWTGWYGGGNTGYSWGRSRTTITSGGGATTPFDESIRHHGWEFSGEGGYCWQPTAKTVDCIEIRYDGPREKGRITGGPGGVVETQPRVPSTIMIGPHFGFLTDMNHMLWYVSGGLAIGESGATTNIAGSTLVTSDKWKAGFYIGAGIERMIDQHWSWKLEYDYVRMGGGGVSATFPIGTFPVIRGGFTDPVTVNSNKNAYDNKISFGINYHFGSR